MKKVASFLAFLIVVFGLTACGDNKLNEPTKKDDSNKTNEPTKKDKSDEYDFTCTGTIDDEEMTIGGIVKDGKVTTIIAETKTATESEEEAQTGAVFINGMGSLSEDNGMTMTAKASGKDVVLTMTIDVAKTAAASEDDSQDNSLGIDLSKATKSAVIEAFEQQGLKCK